MMMDDDRASDADQDGDDDLEAKPLPRRLFGQPARQRQQAAEPAPKADKMKITPRGVVDNYGAADAWSDNQKR